MPYAKQRTAAEQKTYISTLLLQEYPLEEIAKLTKLPVEKVLILQKEIEQEWQLKSSYSQDESVVLAKAESLDAMLINLAMKSFQKSKMNQVTQYYNYEDGNKKPVTTTKRITHRPEGDLAWLRFILDVSRHRTSMGKLYENLDHIKNPYG